MKLFKCQSCAQIIYFENLVCERCKHQLGFIPASSTLSAVEQKGADLSALDGSGLYRACANAALSDCNWLIPANSQESFCAACRHNRTIPDLSVSENLTRFRRMEAAKRRMFYSILRLNLPVENRVQNPEDGLAFDFLAEAPETGLREVVTGHEHGLITINLKEADDAEREKMRLSMRETYRTLLGHFRHEIGHYFWDRLVGDGPELAAFREVFGDESQDYSEALNQHYKNGPPADWRQNFISHYASSHPWEDFAETWAHYLHIVDTLEMAFAYGIRIHLPLDGINDKAARVDFDPHEVDNTEALINVWLPLAMAVNSINRCMGELDLYPFVLTPTIIGKLGYVHRLVRGVSQATVPADRVPATAALSC